MSPPSKAILKELYYVEDLSWKEIGQRLGFSYSGIQYWMLKYDIQTKKRRGTHGYNHNRDFFKSWSPEMAWVLGLMFADGNVTRAGTTSWSCTISSMDPSMVEKIRSIIATEAPVRIHKNHSAWLTVGAGDVGDDLISLGCVPRKSRIMQFPPVPMVYLSHFVRGLWDGDGTIFKTHISHYQYIRSGYTCGSKDFIIALRDHILDSTDLNATIVTTKRQYKPYHLISYFHHGTISLARWMYENSTPTTRLNRKYQIVAPFLLS